MITISFFLFLGMQVNAQTARPITTVTAEQKFKLYPNPATSYVQIDWTVQIKPSKISISNAVTGKEMMVNVNGLNSYRLTVSDFLQGLYVLRMFSATGTYLGGSTFQVSK
ncbi:MAG: T9SS type A sorting domain-containing protein [Bacteroidota bacterium]